jgi:hypothetical protein
VPLFFIKELPFRHFVSPYPNSFHLFSALRLKNVNGFFKPQP